LDPTPGLNPGFDRADEGKVEHDDGGFTLIELMVVVLIIAILLAIAIPTFLGARQRANDRAAQSNLRNANTNALVFYTDRQQFTDDPLEMTQIDASLSYTNVLASTTHRNVYVSVPAVGTYFPFDTVYLAARSTNGPCFWIRTVGDKAEPRFAQNDCAAVPADAAFSDQW
jgi:type IV pilus assembly protein PilA